ncbi:molybdopterin oxidoreductase family protein [Horticoccus sp. 23ND18S-11]|uniref:molybdopterin oxidoreductase family protein n=1 Tax=Horticoccus sp. 23ND18S-11 TaxID=3391832 RepID=UPI0039C931FA
MTLSLDELLRARAGPMTADMVLHPAKFGLGRVPARLQPAATTTSVCGFCSTGCGLKVHLNEEGEAINLSADPAYPVNRGMACPKGWEALTPLASADRVTLPLIRDRATPGAMLASTSWEHALAAFTERFKGIQRQHGPDAVAILSTGQIVMEEMALLGALAKFGLGVTHIDSNTRQCMATSHVAYKQSFGFDAPPFTYADFEESDALIFIGANPCIAHPIMWQRVMRNRRNPEIIVIDPRLTETAQAATLHVPARPKSDLTLLYGIAHLLIARGAVRRDFIAAHTTGFDAFENFVRDFTPQRVATETGLTVELLHRLADIIASRERVSFWWTMGVNQSHEATRTAQAIINLALMTGNIGRPGTGANSITGQCNAMGSRLFGNATSLLGGYDFANEGHRRHVARILDLPAAAIPDRTGYAYDQILDGIERGEIRGLWVIATNPAHSWVHQSRARELLAKLDFLVVQDMYASTETAQLADLVLPAAGWGEKDGVFINSERRLGLARKVARAPGQALSDFSIFKLIADAWGCAERFRAWSSPEATFQLLKELSRGQPCDFSGIRDYAHLEDARGIQWPYPEDRRPETGDRNQLAAADAGLVVPDSGLSEERRLFADGRFFTPDQRARFLFDPPRPLPEPTDRDFPFTLLTGRGSSAQWHTGSRTDKSAVLRKLAPTVQTVEINPVDAERLGIAAGKSVEVKSRRGTASALAVVTATVQPGQIFMPMHFAALNQLTFAAFDPHSRQPAYKACAVAVSPTL